MPIDEIFPNPTLRQVIFQMRFPTLFYVENKIGDFQMRVVDRFPESSLVHRRQLLFADVGPERTMKEIGADDETERGKKIWRFESDEGLTLNVLMDSLDITSQRHETYNLEGGRRFRETLDFVLTGFFDVVSVPILKRVGLRYINFCPIPDLSNEEFTRYYNSVFPLERFPVDQSSEMRFRACSSRDSLSIRYIESLDEKDGDHRFILDLDAFATDIRPTDCLSTVDELHALIVQEYQSTIRDPVYDYMRQTDEE